MKQLYINIREQLETIVPDLLYVRLFNNQFEKSNNDNEAGNTEQAFPYPCAFIEFPGENQPISSSLGSKRLDVTVRIHIGFESYDLEDTYVFDLAGKVKDCLDMWQSSVNGAMTYNAQRMDANHSNVYIYTIDFKCTYYDESNYSRDKLIPKATATTIVPTVNLIIDNPIIRTGYGS